MMFMRDFPVMCTNLTDEHLRCDCYDSFIFIKYKFLIHSQDSYLQANCIEISIHMLLLTSVPLYTGADYIWKRGGGKIAREIFFCPPS